MGFWQRLRKWVDNEREDALQVVFGEMALPSASEKLFQQMLKAVDKVLREEKLSMPDGKTYFPNNFIVFIDENTYNLLPDEKREIMAQGLSKQTFIRAKEIAGKSVLSATSFNIEIKVNVILSQNEIEVKVVSINEKTIDNQQQDLPLPQSPGKAKRQSKKKSQPKMPVEEPTIKPWGIIEVWRDGKQENTFMATKEKVIIGRESKINPPDVVLKTDNTVSRSHIELRFHNDGKVWLKPNNVIWLNGKILNQNQETEISAEQEIKIGEFIIRVNAIGFAFEAEDTLPSRFEDLDATIKALYFIEIWQDDKRQRVIPVFNQKVTVGRVWKKHKPEIELDDESISRTQAEFIYENEKLFLIVKGRRAMKLEGKAIPKETKTEINFGQEITVGRFALRIQSLNASL